MKFKVGDKIKWLRTSAKGEICFVSEVDEDGVWVSPGEYWKEEMFVTNQQIKNNVIILWTPLDDLL